MWRLSAPNSSGLGCPMPRSCSSWWHVPAETAPGSHAADLNRQLILRARETAAAGGYYRYSDEREVSKELNPPAEADGGRVMREQRHHRQRHDQPDERSVEGRDFDHPVTTGQNAADPGRPHDDDQ